jgi:uncharacterized protein YkwD
MSVHHSASGRGTVRRPRGPAKVILLPAGRRSRRHRRTLGFAIAGAGVVVVGVTLVWLYLLPLIQLMPWLTAGVSAQESEIMRLVNDERRRAGEPPLRMSQRLTLAARGHSYDMALRRYLGHDGPAGDTPAERVRSVGVDYARLGENVYMESGENLRELARRAVMQWMASPGHRANILSSEFTATGVGVARAADGTTYVTQDFVE